MYDNGTLNKILDILNDEKKILEKIVKIEEKKCNLLTDNNFVDLEELDNNEAELVTQLNALEKERLFTGNKMAQNQKTESLRDMINNVSGDEKNELIQMQHCINAVLQKLQFIKSVTLSILKDKQDLIDITLAEARGESSDMEYTDKGQTQKVSKKPNSIIINKSI